jgi:hypothetical protein
MSTAPMAWGARTYYILFSGGRSATMAPVSRCIEDTSPSGSANRRGVEPLRTAILIAAIVASFRCDVIRGG